MSYISWLRGREQTRPKEAAFAWAYYWNTHTNAYHLMQNFILNPNVWSKKYYPTYFRENLYLKICVDSEKNCGQKNWHKILSHNICILQMCELYVIHKSKFLKNEPWLITHDHKCFSKIWKPNKCLFLTRIMIVYRKINNHSVLPSRNKNGIWNAICPLGGKLTLKRIAVTFRVVVDQKTKRHLA